MEGEVQLVRARCAELRSQISTAEQELKRLEAFLSQVEEIERQIPLLLKSLRESRNEPGAGLFGRGGEFTVDMIERVMEQHGPTMHVNSILDHLYSAGWQGSGDRRKDYKNLFTNLLTKPKRFKKLGKGLFERLIA